MTAKKKTTELTLPERAQVALQSAEHEKKLTELAAGTKNITELKNRDGRDECHSVAMTLKNTRVAIEKASKAAREDATAFQKAVIAEEKRLISIIEPDEKRLFELRDGWDAAREAERKAAEEAERQRVAENQGKIDAMRNLPSTLVNADTTVLAKQLEWVVSYDMVHEIDNDFRDAMRAALDFAGDLIKTMHTAAVEREAEAKRVAAEREELARMRAEMEARRAERLRVEAEDFAKRDAEMRDREEEAERQRRLIEKQHREIAEKQAALAAQEAELERARQAALPPEPIPQEDIQAVRDFAEPEQNASFEACVLPHLPDGIKGVFAAAGVFPAAPMSDLFDQADSLTANTAKPSDDELVSVIANHYHVSEDTAMEWLVEMAIFNTANQNG